MKLTMYENQIGEFRSTFLDGESLILSFKTNDMSKDLEIRKISLISVV